MTKKKICVVLTVRGNYAKTKSLLLAIKRNPRLELQIIVGGAMILPKYGNPVTLLEKDGLRVNAKLAFLLEGETLLSMTKSAGLAMVELSTVLDQLKPDILVAIADRFEALPIAMTAAYMNIPFAHTEGGEVSGSIDESIRHAITKLSHLHFVATEQSRRRVIRMGEAPSRVFVSGSPSIDCFAKRNLRLDFDVFKRYPGVGNVFDISRGYLMVIQHPVTTEYGMGFEQVNQTLLAVQRLNMPTLWLWPNMDAGADDVSKGIRIFRERNRNVPVHFFKNFVIEDYAVLLRNCSCFIGNSSSGVRECSFLGTPVVSIGTRQQGREKGKNVVTVPYEAKAIQNAVRRQIAHGRYPKDTRYGDGKAGKRIADILARLPVKPQKKITY